MFYNLDVKIDVVSDISENELTHVIFDLKFNNEQFNQSNSCMSISKRTVVTDLKIESEIFFELFPFHIVFKRTLEIISIGEGLKQVLKHYQGECINDIFNLVRPLVNFSWQNVRIH